MVGSTAPVMSLVGSASVGVSVMVAPALSGESASAEREMVGWVVMSMAGLVAGQ